MVASPNVRFAPTSSSPTVASPGTSRAGTRNDQRIATTARTIRLTVTMRMTVIVITTLPALPRASATSEIPSRTADAPARRTGCQPASPRTSGPLASTTPTRAMPIPATCRAAGRSPSATPTTSGTSTPRAAIGETTPMVPIARAR